MDAFLKDGDPSLGFVPGPLALATSGDVLWAAGGGRGESALLRYDRDGWRARAVDAMGLRDVLPRGEREVLVVGERGYIAIIDDDRERGIASGTDGCLYSIAAAGSVVWITGDSGFLAALDDGLVLRPVERFTKGRILRAVVGPSGELVLATARQVIRRDRDGTTAVVLDGPADLTDIAFAPDGTWAITGDRGQLYLGAPGQRPAPVAGVPELDLNRLVFDPREDAFRVVGQRGFVGVLRRDGTLEARDAAVPAYQLTSLVAWDGGYVYSGWEQQGPPYRFRGALYADGATPPRAIAATPLAAFPPRRTRTVGTSGRPALGADAGTVIPIDEARARLPDVDWPETDLTVVRFYDGDVHVSDTDALLDNTERRGFAVAIRGDLIVDGLLDATAGGDGYDSALVVHGDVWAEAAVFRYGIKATITGTLEVASVVMCDHGDDGGTLWARAIRAQVVSYSLYFSRPDGEIDALCIGDVYGEASFDPERAREVFVADILEDGRLDEGAAAEALRAGRRILRET